MKRVKFIFPFFFIFVFMIILTSCKKDDGTIIIKDIEITDSVESIYTQPENLNFKLYITKGGREKFLMVSYNYIVHNNDEIVNIAPEYGGYIVKYYDSGRAGWHKNNTVKKLILPDTVTSITGTIRDFSALEEIYIPKNVIYIDLDMFMDSNGSVKKITVSEENKNFKIKNNALYDEKNGIFYYYLKDDNLTQYKVYQAKVIASDSFAKTNLTSIIFDEGVEIIDNFAIVDNNYLKSITLPSTFKGFNTNVIYGVGLPFNVIAPDIKDAVSYIKEYNPNLETIYSYADIDVDLSDIGIEYIKLSKLLL